MTELHDVSGDDRTEAVELAAAALRRGELVVLPTDTLYGIAADAFSRTGTRKVFETKRRDRALPLPVLVRTPKQLTGLCTTVPPAAERLMTAYWPGPLTIVLAHDPNLLWDLGDNQGTVAVRMPLDDVALEVIRAVGPLAVTSANRSGRPTPPTASEVRDELGDAVSLYLDAGPRTSTTGSVIVDLTRREPHILREGPLPADEVVAVARGDLDPFDVTPPAPPSGPDGPEGG